MNWVMSFCIAIKSRQNLCFIQKCLRSLQTTTPFTIFFHCNFYFHSFFFFFFEFHNKFFYSTKNKFLFFFFSSLYYLTRNFFSSKAKSILKGNCCVNNGIWAFNWTFKILSSFKIARALLMRSSYSTSPRPIEDYSTTSVPSSKYRLKYWIFLSSVEIGSIFTLTFKRTFA